MAFFINVLNSRRRETGIHQCLEIDKELSWLIKIIVESDFTTNSDDRTLTSGNVVLPMMRLETYVLHGLHRSEDMTRSVYGSCISWTPMYLLLNVVKLDVESLNTFLGSTGVHGCHRNWGGILVEPISSNEQQARTLNIYAVLDVVLHLCSFPQTVSSINNTNIPLPFTSTNHLITWAPIFFQSCKTKSGTGILGLRLPFLYRRLPIFYQPNQPSYHPSHVWCRGFVAVISGGFRGR